jgi:hypothetical protein
MHPAKERDKPTAMSSPGTGAVIEMLVAEAVEA